MINYQNIIKTAKNDYSIILNKLNIKNKNLIDPNIKNDLSDSVKITNTNTSNKDYKNNLLKFSNIKQMAILLKGLHILNKNLNYLISKWNTTELFRFISISKKDQSKNKNLIPLSHINFKNKNSKISPYMYGDNKLLIHSKIKINKLKSQINTFINLKLNDSKKTLNLNQTKNIDYVNNIKLNKNLINMVNLNKNLLTIKNLKKNKENQIGSIFKESLNTNINKSVNKSRPIVPLINIKSRPIFPIIPINSRHIVTIVPLNPIKPKQKKFTLSDKFSDYKFLIELNKTNNYKRINNISNYIHKITNFNSKSAYSFSKNYNYKFNKSTTANNKLTNNLYTFLESSFFAMSVLISKPIFIITPDKVIIHLFYYQIKLLNKKVHTKILVQDKTPLFKTPKEILKLKIISQILAKYFKKPVEFDMINLLQISHNSNIFVKFLGLIVNKMKLRVLKKNFFDVANIINPITLLNDSERDKNFPYPSYISGMKLRVAGRLLTQRIIPRKTVKTFSTGCLARGKILYLEQARFTNKNRRGAFSITLSTGHFNP